jgi:hypothetical protein
LDFSIPDTAADGQVDQEPAYPNGSTNEIITTHEDAVLNAKSLEEFCSNGLNQLDIFQGQFDDKLFLREMDAPNKVPGSCAYLPPSDTLNFDLASQANLERARSAQSSSFQSPPKFSGPAWTEQRLARRNAISQNRMYTAPLPNSNKLGPFINFEPTAESRIWEGYGEGRAQVRKEVQQHASTTVESLEKHICGACQRDRKTFESGNFGQFPCLRCPRAQRNCSLALKWIEEDPSRISSGQSTHRRGIHRKQAPKTALLPKEASGM